MAHSNEHFIIHHSVQKPDIAPLLSFKTFPYATYLSVSLCGELLLIGKLWLT